MQLSEAIQLIRGADIGQHPAQTWADLGCGKGLFTRALFSLLPERSRMYAIDKSNTFEHNEDSSRITFHQADFENDDLKLSNLDGILMANSLHYVADPVACIRRLNSYFSANTEQYILVEYDSTVANQWVPYPLPFSTIRRLFGNEGFSRIEKLNEKKSFFRQGNIYACHVQR